MPGLPAIRQAGLGRGQKGFCGILLNVKFQNLYPPPAGKFQTRLPDGGQVNVKY